MIFKLSFIDLCHFSKLGRNIIMLENYSMADHLWTLSMQSSTSLLVLVTFLLWKQSKTEIARITKKCLQQRT